MLCMKQKCASPASGKNRNNKKGANSPCSISLTMITKLMFIAYFFVFLFSLSAATVIMKCERVKVTVAQSCLTL